MNDIEFLQAYLQHLREQYERSLELCHSDISPPQKSTDSDRDAERTARLADANGLNGGLFRDHLTRTHDDDPLSLAATKRLVRKIEAIPRIIAAIETKPVASDVSENTKLLTVAQLAKTLNIGQSTLRERNRKGLIPKPIRIGGSLRWNTDEINSWLKHKCPPRAEWERTGQTWTEVNDATT